MRAVEGFKIWAVNDCDWIWGTGFAQALHGYMQMTGMDLQELFDENDGDIDSKSCELSNETVTKLMIRDEEGTDVRTFAQELKLRAKEGDDVGFFASTEF